jgi:hypothetical protein
VLLTVGLVVAAAIHVWVRLSELFYFHHDDLLQFSVAQEHGLSWDLLRLDVFGHFAPFNRLVHLFFVRVADVNLEVGALLVTGLVVALLVTTVWLCRELGLSYWRRTFVLVMTGFSVAVVDTAVWLDAALHILAALTVTYAVVAAHVRALRTGRRRWHVISVVLFVAGFATQERTAFALPLIVLVDLFLVGAGRTWRERVALLWRSRWPLLAMTLLSVVAGALLLRFYGAAHGNPPSLGAVGEVFAGFVTTVLLPMLVGVVPSQLPAAAVQAVIGLVLVLCAVWLVRRNRQNAGPLLVVLGTACMYYGFLRFSPILIPQNVEQTALRLNNAIYLVVPTLVALAHLRLSPDRRGGVPATPPSVVARERRWTRLAGRTPVRVVAVVLTAAFLVVTVGSYTDRAWGPARQGHAFIENVAADVDAWSSPDVTLLPLRVPDSVASGWAEVYGREAHFLKYFVNGWAPAPLGERPVVLDDHGRLRDVILRQEAAAELPPVEDGPLCVRSRPGADFLVLPLERTVHGGPLFAQLSYRLIVPEGTGVSAVVSATDPDAGDVASWSSYLPAGRHTIVAPLEADSATSIGLSRVPVGTTLCVSAASVVRPLYVIEGNCVRMDVFGATTRATDCPTRRRGGR